MKNYLILICSVFTLCSCQKENSNDNIVPADPVLLKKFIELDPASTPPNDTVSIREYSYDNLGRCVSIKNLYFPGMEVDYTYNYYNGADSLMASRTLLYDGSSDTSKEIFTYSANGLLLSDSTVTISTGGTNSLVYKYNESNGLIRSEISLNGQPFMIASYEVQRDINGNITFESDSSFEYLAGSGYVYRDVSDITNSYDNNPCPFYKLYPKRLVELDYENALADDVPFYWSIPQRNNILSEARITSPITSGLTPYNHSFSYTYHANGYPSMVLYFDNLTGDAYKGIYLYE